ncbi:MAG: phosphate ABC transporter substrate-binding protein PstS [Syntrophobacteraceae bacterium]|jgi:phosphate transport system substrate-binding protein
MIIRKLLCLSVASFVLGLGLFCSTAGAAEDYVKLIGAGASFPAPLYTKWFKDYHGFHPNVQVDYQSVGSGSGIKNFISKTVDFGASDAGMTTEQRAEVEAGVQLLPMTAGAIVLSYNLADVPELKLPREAYAGIFLGKVTKWNDPLIAKANPDVKLPDSAINVVVRADSSGTTYVFSQHLAAINPDFAKSPGVNMMPNWAVGTRSKGNEGITASLHTTPGSIGYVEYGYAKGQRMPMAALENKAGKFVKASTASAQASLTSVEMPADLMAWLPDPTGDDSYPIVTYTWLLCYKHYDDANKLNALKGVIEYGLTEGQKSSELFGYVPLPAPVVAKVKDALNNIQGK